MTLAIDRPDERTALPVTPIDLHVTRGAYTITSFGETLGTFANAADAWAALDQLDAPAV